jgi:hypothetical protein
LLKEFFDNASLPRNYTTAFITLIPKVDNPQKLKYFRPISLVGNLLYKIVAKILARRLKSVLKGVIGDTQSAFLLERSNVDGIVALNEAIDEAKRVKRGCLIFKADFDKAYDSASWGYLDDMMEKRVSLTNGGIGWQPVFLRVQFQFY